MLSSTFGALTRVAAISGLAAGLVAATVVVTGAAGAPAAPDSTDSTAAQAASPTPSMPSGGGRPGRMDPRFDGMPFHWSATTPATHLGDTYRITITNGATAQRVFVSTLIMDHEHQTNPKVLEELLRLGPNESRTLTAVNDYGTANHFATRLASENRDLRLQVTVTNAAGEVVAQFNQNAFMVREASALPPRQGQGSQQEQPGQHDHGRHQHKTPTPTPTN